MAEPLASVEEVAARSATALPLDDVEAALMEQVIKMVSAQVRFHGLPWADTASAPDIAVSIAVEASARVFMNPQGYDLERGDQLTLGRNENQSTGTLLDDREIRILQTFNPTSRSKTVAVLKTYNSDYPRPRHKGNLAREERLRKATPYELVGIDDWGTPLRFFHEHDPWWRP